MSYEKVILNIIRSDAETLLEELDRRNQSLSTKDYVDYQILFSSDDILGMISWICSLEDYLEGRNEEE